MHNDIAYVLYSEQQLKECCKRLARQIEKDYAGKDLVCVCILKGGVMFMTDLIREVNLPLSMEFMAASSYGSGTTSAGVVRILKDLDKDITGKHVLIVEDIVDTGNTLSYLSQYLRASRGAADISICTLLNKPERREAKDLEVKYIGFEVPNEFVVGYGLDYDEKYRNLPYIGVLKPEVYEKD
ncbi:MAG: hypoxanthine phosphoribosyltransferase [Clostridia bacterium]|nr:hypoxanthine phosphoribosyltransferase [Clostridia bacterium]MBQ4086517.1 hypoxanthine phosphoribosyltransferase [Clostridia bacterium]